jgi:hypothetical protein
VVPPILERAMPVDPPKRPQPEPREPRPIVVRVEPDPPAVPSGGAQGGGSGGGGGGGSHSIHGLASWYCRAGVSPCTVTHPDGGGFDAYAAAGPRLRAAIGSGWRGTVVSVDGVRVKLIDWCQCYKGEPQEKLLDLYYDVYRRVGGNVTIRW